MFIKRSRSGYGARTRRKRVLHTAAFIVLAAVLISLFPAVFLRLKNARKNENGELQDLWEAASYEKVYAESGERLKQRPLDPFLLTLRGFSAYQIAVAQINNSNTLAYIDDCIWSLRKALISGRAKDHGQLYYVLGKAYYNKGPSYADLSVKYLETARNLGIEAQDMSQYLGLAYAAVRDYRGSVAAFTLALGEEPSDILLISIANSYIALGESGAAQAYLYRCVEKSRDYRSVSAARFLLGGILEKNGDFSGAEEQYLTILEESGEDAEAHFRLGELYTASGDTTRARAEWRRAVYINPAHRQAAARITG